MRPIIRSNARSVRVAKAPPCEGQLPRGRVKRLDDRSWPICERRFMRLADGDLASVCFTIRKPVVDRGAFLERVVRIAGAM